MIAVCWVCCRSKGKTNEDQSSFHFEFQWPSDSLMSNQDVDDSSIGESVWWDGGSCFENRDGDANATVSKYNYLLTSSSLLSDCLFWSDWDWRFLFHWICYPRFIHAQAEIQRMRLELGRVAQERDSYKQKCDTIHRVNQQHGNHQQQHQPQQQQQQQQQQSKSNRTAGSQINDGPTSYYLWSQPKIIEKKGKEKEIKKKEK